MYSVHAHQPPFCAGNMTSIDHPVRGVVTPRFRAIFRVDPFVILGVVLLAHAPRRIPFRLELEFAHRLEPHKALRLRARVPARVQPQRLVRRVSRDGQAQRIVAGRANRISHRDEALARGRAAAPVDVEAVAAAAQQKIL